MKTLKQLLMLTSLTVISVITFTNPAVAQEKRPAALEKWIGTWEAELYKMEPDTMLKSTGYTRPNIWDFKWSQDSTTVISTYKRYYQGQWLIDVSLLAYDKEKNETHGLSAYGPDIETFQGEDASTIKSYSFDGTLTMTQTLKWESKDLVHAVNEFASFDFPVKAYFKIRRKK